MPVMDGTDLKKNVDQLWLKPQYNKGLLEALIKITTL